MRNNKKKLIALTCILCLGMFTGCSNKGENTTTSTDISAVETASTQTSEVDIDLTEMSSTMIYAEVFEMTNNPSAYIGKTVKIKGTYNQTYWEETDTVYHNIIIADAAACCSSGLEFLDSSNDYSKYVIDEETEIIGTFDSYEELGHTYYYINVDSAL